MTGHELLVPTVIVVALMSVAMVGMFLWLRLLRSGYFHRRRQAREAGDVEADRAFSAVITSEAISHELLDRGFTSPQATALVEDARQAYAEGNPEEAEALSSQARTILMEALQADHEDHATHATALEEEIPESKPVLGKEFPKHSMEAKFLLGVIKGRVTRTKKDSKRGTKVRNLWERAKTAYEKEDYSGALTYAVQCRRLLDGKSPKARKPRPKCPECGTPLLKTDDFCGKCGTNLTGTPGCRACGAPWEEGDRFCRKCGATNEILVQPP